MKQECIPILLPTKEKSMLYLSKEFGLKWSKDGPFVNGITNTQNHFLYICSNEEIKQGDWFYTSFEGKDYVHQCSGSPDRRPDRLLSQNGNYQFTKSNCKKIIASTDKSLGLPSIPQSFIQLYIDKYNKGEKLEKCMVEYGFIEDKDPRIRGYYTAEDEANLILKLNGNEIIISEYKEKLYTKEEIKQSAVKHLYNKAYSAVGGSVVSLKDIDEWLKQHI